MHLMIDVDLDAVSGDPGREIARILRFWAGALPSMELVAGLEQELRDSQYAVVGTLRIVASRIAE